MYATPYPHTPEPANGITHDNVGEQTPKSTGSTGPLVYPAGHVYIFSFLHSATDEGRNIALAQLIFAGLYLVTLALVMATYRQSGAPPYLYPLLVVSKRLHSIFMLRMFNDGVATLFLWATIYMLQKRRWRTAVLFWSAGVSVKMTLLLVAPALAVILTLSVGFPNAVGLGMLSLLLQLLIAVPFLQRNPVGYFSRAFEFTRQFLFKWTGLLNVFIDSAPISSISLTQILLALSVRKESDKAGSRHFAGENHTLSFEKRVRQQNNVDLTGCRSPLCKKLALPVLFVPRMGDTVAALAIKRRAIAHFRYMFNPRIRLERVSKHFLELNDGCTSPCATSPSLCSLATIKQRTFFVLRKSNRVWKFMHKGLIMQSYKLLLIPLSAIIPHLSRPMAAFSQRWSLRHRCPAQAVSRTL
ncbi:conserved hypothetical protein [Uncinocarpus reesii 1704]|uniref:Dol-P-Man:Man(5)GlcNAc(2)-PP-Dol alpha-1,3-mannosyltransferase n=1 Tax=Uncinocarpus reesii (strain UAMH 1704) TaxID=336963 RepID=C4JS13_UNCRE|nr:uncharacterized protein UREG_05252 [Uncinocarpus reesii 1704]EEP80410.1 conserved hypothetical protein [Uncinocarpus reesii 1704]